MNKQINPEIAALMPLFMSPTLRFALVKYGGGIVGMSGSIAGNTHARNRYGNYIRARTKPINPNTAAQQAVRASLTLLTERWAETLTPAQRTAWGLYASNVTMKNKLGESIKLSGFNHYIRSSSLWIRAGGDAFDDAPTIFTLPDTDPQFSITASEASQAFTVTFDDSLAWASEVNGALHMFGGSPQNPQRNFFAGPWKLASGFVGNGPVTSPRDTGSPFTITEGQRVWLYARINRADGRLSSRFEAQTLVGA